MSDAGKIRCADGGTLHHFVATTTVGVMACEDCALTIELTQGYVRERR